MKFPHVFELTEKAKKFAAEYTEEEMLAVLQTIPEFKMDSYKIFFNK